MDSQAGHESHGPGSSVGVVGGGVGGGGAAKRPYEESSSESVVSFATDSVSVAQNSVVSGSVANSVLGPDGKRSVKSSVSTTGCRQRITVVCAECKRLKLKCDRRTPCGSCTKRDTIPRCIYSQAAAEKVDVQSLHIRLQAVEGKVSDLQIPSGSSAPVAGPSTRDRKLSTHTLPSTATDSNAQPRAFLAVGAHGASVAVNLEGAAGLWIDHLGLRASAMTTRATPATIGELDLERMGGTTRRRESGSAIELRPFPSVSSEGILDFIEDTTNLFRVPASLVTTRTDEDTTLGETGAEHEEVEDSEQVGVAPKLVYHALPPAHVRSEIYKRFEQNHLMSTSVNLFVLKNRIEEMCRWAEAELSKSSGSGSQSRNQENGRSDEPHPTYSLGTMGSTGLGPPSSTPGSTTGAGAFAPTLTFFAAAAFCLALGARCCVIERDVLGDSNGKPGSSAAGDRAYSPGSSNVPSAPGPSTSAYNKIMPPPPLPAPVSSFDNGTSTSPVSPPSGPSSAHRLSVLSELDPALPANLYRLGKFALNLALERAGYEAFDTDYIYARCLQVRYLLMSYHGLDEGARIFRGFGVGQRKKVEKRKGKAKVNGISHGEELGDMSVDDVPAADIRLSARNKGKERAPTRGPVVALAPETVGAVGDAVGNARMMGLNHDPEFAGGGKFSVYEIEMRRRLWWELVTLDAFVAKCLGESPLINDDSATTEFPTDVDEESFGPDSANCPAPNIESVHGNIEHFIQRCRLTELGKKLGRKAAAFRELHPDPQPGETRDLLMNMKSEIADWLANLPDHLKLKDVPVIPPDVKSMSPSMKKQLTSVEREDTVSEESPYLIMQRCRLAISARHMFMMLCLPFIKGNKPEAKGDTKAKEGSKSDYLGPSANDIDALLLLEPAIYIVQVWRYVHSVVRDVHPALFMCYVFTKELFDAAVVLGHLAIEQPLFAHRALASLRLAFDTICDPSVLTSKPSFGAEESGGNVPSESVRIIEELILKAETASAAANAGFGGGFGPSGASTPSIMKRKHEEVETASSDLLYHFHFPFVGAGVVSAGPPAPVSGAGSPQTDGGGTTNTMGARASEPTATATARGGTAGFRSTKHGTGATMDATAATTATGDPRPATSKLKSTHPQVSIRNRNRKESSRARANSSASQRSDMSHMLPPANPPATRPSNSPSSHPHPHAATTHSVPPPPPPPHNRISSVEPATPLIGASSYPGPLSTTPGPGPPHYTSPPGTSAGGPSSSSQQPQTSGSEFSSGFDTGGFHSSSPASYGPSFSSQNGPSLPVPSQLAFDGFSIGPSGSARAGVSMGNGDPSAYGFGSTNGIDRPGPVGIHQPSGFDSIGRLPGAPSDSSQDRPPFSRNPSETRTQNRSTDDQLNPAMQSFEHPQHPQPPHPPLHPPQSYPPHLQPGWYDHSSWSYYQG